MATKPQKPTPDFPLFAHSGGVWAKKVGGKLHYYGPWSDPQAALDRYNTWLAGKSRKGKTITRGKKPDKPHPDFPLYRHPCGQWAKKVRGKLHYFGTDPDAALEKWTKQKDDLLVGRVPQDGDGLTVGRLCNVLLSSKQRLVDSGEIKVATWYDYKQICVRVIKVFGPGRRVENLSPADFERLRADFATTHNATSLCDDITRARVLFNYAFDANLIDRPVKYGNGFKKPSKKTLRINRQEKSKRMFPAVEIRQILDKAGLQLRAMIYLGINCGLGNNDCAMLPKQALDLKNGWLDFGRPKTGIHRRCPLWPETVTALRAALDKRPTPQEGYGDRVFLTHRGVPWEPKAVHDNPISKEFVKVAKDLKIHRKGVGFYALRHTFQTIGGKTQDKDAVRAIMGHAEASNDMSAVYNEEPVDDARLQAVTDYVRAWLFPKTEGGMASSAKKSTARIHYFFDAQRNL